MTDRHRRISLQQQLRQRTSNDLTATDDARIRTTDFDTAVVEEFHDAGRSARHEHGSSHSQLARAYRMKPVDVLRWIDSFDDCSLVDLARQRQLSENAVDAVARVQSGDQSEQF